MESQGNFMEHLGNNAQPYICLTKTSCKCKGTLYLFTKAYSNMRAYVRDLHVHYLTNVLFLRNFHMRTQFPPFKPCPFFHDIHRYSLFVVLL